MDAGSVVGIAVMLMCASAMVTVGISQYTAQNPVTFYSFEKAPAPSELTDVRAWNRAHGRMWIVYGAYIAVCVLPFALGMRDAVGVAIMCGGVLLPIPLLIVCHNKFKQKYYVNNKKTD